MVDDDHWSYQRFCAWRTRLGLTCNQVAREFGLSERTVNRWRSAGELPKRFTLACEGLELRMTGKIL